MSVRSAQITSSILLLFCSLGSISCMPSSNTVGDCVSDYEVKHLSLSVTYGPGFCNAVRDDCRGPYTDFSIHGLWPNVRGMSNEEKCCTKEKNVLNTLQPLMPKLKTDWRNLRGQDKNTWLWDHEWEKHGRCAHKIPQISSAQLYFQFALDQFKRLRIMSHLKAAGISPSNKKLYQGSQIAQVLKSAYGHEVEMICKEARNSPNKMVLTEVRICYGSDLKIKDCINSTRNRCLGDLTVLAE